MKLLSIIKKTNNYKPNYFDNLDTLKHFPSSTREWNNSIFLYNENALPLIPHTSKLAIKIIKNYFNIYNKKIESYIRTKRLLRRLRKLSSNRIYISNGEFKHTNNKVTITLYVYNKQKNNYLLKLKKRYLRKFFNKMLRFKRNKTLDLKAKRLNNKIILIKKIKNINTKGLKAILKANWYKYKIIKVLEKINKKKEIRKYVSISKYVNNFYKKLVKRSLKRLEIYIFYKQLIYINKSKFNYTYLQYLKNHLQLLFNKNIEFNFINLKHFYLNSNILSESILLKITKNRKRLFKLLKRFKEKVKIRNKIKFINKPLLITKLDLKKHFYKKTLLQKYIIKNLKYRHIIGFRLEAKGRLTRRYTASRSVHKLRYEGNLLNIDSSYNGIPSVLLKGNLRSNLQYTKLNSKTRIGSFGIKGWVNGN
jgi:hypothetical protein